MPARRIPCALAAILALAVPAAAQPTESVTVTGTKSRQVLEKFIESFAAPTRMTGKIARWEDGVCPVTVGLRPAAVKFVTQRVRDVAALAGAPVNAKPDCTANIEIVFTTTPQKLLDGVRRDHAMFLGYHDDSAQADALAKVIHPIQAWYTTATRDLQGKLDLDSGQTLGPGLQIWLPCNRTPGVCLMTLPNAHADAVTGSRLGDGLHSTLYHVIIVADPTRLANYEIGALADYIALLALSQLSSLDACQQLASIVNLLAPGCAPTLALSDNDLAYLRGLYKMSPGRTLRTQQDEIGYQMQNALGGG